MKIFKNKENNTKELKIHRYAKLYNSQWIITILLLFKSDNLFKKYQIQTYNIKK